ncbi:MAG: ATP-binding protein [Sideroxyarcus sp.]|nr:ATP-binding protein [Sideroxyarcus sp.]
MLNRIFNCASTPSAVPQIEQAKLLYSGLPLIIVINALLALTLAGVQSAVIAPAIVFGWLAAIGAILLVRVVLLAAWRHGAQTVNHAPCWMRRFRITTIATGVAWGTGAALLFPQGDETHQLFLAFVMAGLSAGAITSLAIDRISTLGFLVPTLLPLIANFALEGNKVSFAMGAMIVLFLLFIVVNAMRAGRSLHENIRLRIQAVEQEQVLRDSEARLNQAQHSAHIGNWELDLAGNTLHWSDEVFRIFEIDKTAFAASYEAFLNAIHPDDRDMVNKAYTDSLEKRLPYDIVHRLQFADGRIKFVHERCETHFDAQGKAIRSLGTIQDITSRKVLEKKIQEQRKEMEVLQRTQIAIHTASAIAHEVNQPLLAIATYCNAALLLLKNENPNLKKIGTAVESSERQALRAGQSIRELINFLNTREFPTEELELNNEITGILAAARAEHELQFQSYLQLEDGLPPIRANRLHVRKVLFNLLHNSLDAMQDAGVPLAAITITVRTMADKNVAQVSIRDNGPGFGDEDIQRLFEPFFTTKTNGIGMGLTISRSLVEANGGQLWVDPQESPGATFHLTLPFA